MRIARVLAAITVCGFYAGSSEAQFNKCVWTDGDVVYTDGRCPPGAKSDGKPDTNEPARIPELSWDQQVFAWSCVERWNNEASAKARAAIADDLYKQARAGGEKVEEQLRKAGLTLDRAVKKNLAESVVQPFNSDCMIFGFKSVGSSTDPYNDRASRLLRRELETRYVGSKERYDRARRP